MVEGQGSPARSADEPSNRLMASAADRGPAALEDMRNIMEAALNLPKGPRKQSSAMAKVILMFAQKLHADDSQLEELAAVVQNIRGS
eukprot:2744975-Alexandrium_andersonii.AAC.1